MKSLPNILRNMKIANKSQLDQAIQNNENVVVYFTAAWCGPCKALSPWMDVLSEKYAGEDITFLKIDVDANPDATSDFQVRSIPSVFTVKGSSRYRFVGPQIRANIEDSISTVFGIIG
jgi:thioredoxin 1